MEERGREGGWEKRNIGKKAKRRWWVEECGWMAVAQCQKSGE